MHMYDCPKFDPCSAPICPLDPEWNTRAHLENEAICPYLMMYSKVDGKALLRSSVAVELYEAVASQVSAISAYRGHIERKLATAADHPVRGHKGGPSVR